MNFTNTADRRPRLMIADDDLVTQSMLEMSLGSGFDVVGFAANSDEAVELARESRPDAAIVDVDMPKGGGLSAVRGILAVAPETAIVVLSADESDHVVRELIVAGAITYRRKGVPLGLLAESISDSIKAHGAARAFAA